MNYTKPHVFLLAKPSINNDGMLAWLKHMGASDYYHKKSDSDAESLIMAVAKRCYMSFVPKLNPNVKMVRENVHDYLDHVLASGHGSVLEHASFTFAIEGVSRVFTGEMNRHRAGVAISEGSMRFISFDDIPITETLSMNSRKTPNFESKEFNQMHLIIDAFISEAFAMTQTLYNSTDSMLKRLGYEDLPMPLKKILTSKVRRAVGMGVTTGGVWTFNVRALRHVLELRGTEHAEEEIWEVVQLILPIMIKECPNLFGDFKYDSKTNNYTPKYHKV